MGALQRSPLACGFERALARGAACVDRSILEHLLKTEQIIAIRRRVSTLQRDRLMANSPQLGGAERTGKTGHSVLDWFSQNNMPLGGTSQGSRGMPAPVTVSARISAEAKAAHTIQVVGKTELVTTGLWLPTCD